MNDKEDTKESSNAPQEDSLKEHVHTSSCSHSSDAKVEEEEHCYYKGGPLSHELFSHLPFSVLSVTVGLIMAGLVCFMISEETMAEATQILEATHDHDHGGHDHSGHDHGAHDDHSGHDHGAHGDHSGHDHGAHDDHSGHDHGAHDDHSGHDHSGHDDHSEEPELETANPMGFLFLFHLFHPAHILFSAIATTAMFYKYEKKLFKAIIIGSIGSIVICTISDALIPSVTAKMIGYSSPIHLCILETPMQVIPFAVIGVLLGLAAVFSGTMKSTISSHSVHVITSTMATLFYTIAYTGRLDWINHIGTVFLMTVVAVGGICCLSDVIFPLLFAKEAREEYAKHGHNHPH